MNPFDYVNAINHTKKDLMTGSENDELAERSYVPFFANKALSYFPDTVFHSNEMNRLNHIDHKLQFHYYLNSIRSQKRFAKWVKKDDLDDLDMVKEYYGYNNERAKEALSILSSEQLQIIRKTFEKGG
jgi:hypothetical protein